MDTSSVGLVAAELMERIQDDYGDGVEVGTVAVVVELDLPASEENDDMGATEITCRCSDDRRWVQAGLFEQAKRAVQNGG